MNYPTITDTHLAAYTLLPTAVMLSVDSIDDEDTFYYLWGNESGLALSGFTDIKTFQLHPFKFQGNFKTYIENSLLNAKRDGKAEVVVSRYTESETHTTSFIIKPARYNDSNVMVWLQNHTTSDSISELMLSAIAMRYVKAPMWVFTDDKKLIYQNPPAISFLLDGNRYDQIEPILTRIKHSDDSTLTVEWLLGHDVGQFAGYTRHGDVIRHFQFEVNSATHPKTNQKIFIFKAEDVQELNQQKRLLQHSLAEARTTLNNIRAGIITLSTNGEIGKAYSKFASQVFNDELLAGQNFFNLLFRAGGISKDSCLMAQEAVRTSIGQDEFAFEFNAHVLPLRATLWGRKEVEIDWAPVLDERGNIYEIIVLLRDITEQLAAMMDLEAKDNEIRRLIEVLTCGLPDFRDFAGALSFALNTSDEGFLRSPKLSDDLHMLKGSARMLGLASMASLIHDLEEQLQDHSGDETAADRTLATIKGQIDEYQRIIRKYLGTNINIEDEEKALLDLIACTPLPEIYSNAEPFRRTFVERIVTLQYGRLGAVFEDITKAIEEVAIASSLEKPTFSISGNELLIAKRYVSVVSKIAMQACKNCLSHGIEDSETRTKAGKPPQGQIRIYANRLDISGLRIEISDDGSGLKLKDLRRKLGLSEAAGDETVAEAVFTSNVSTADQVTELSGRGIGMHAIRALAQSYEGTASIVFSATCSPSGSRAFTLRIDLPDGFILPSTIPT